MNIKNIIKFTVKGIDMVSNLSMKKLLITTAITVVPGGLIVSGVYIVGNKVLKKYRKNNLITISEEKIVKKDEKSFLINKKDSIKKLSNNTSKLISNKSTEMKRFAVKKASDFLNKENKS